MTNLSCEEKIKRDAANVRVASGCHIRVLIAGAGGASCRMWAATPWCQPPRRRKISSLCLQIVTSRYIASLLCSCVCVFLRRRNHGRVACRGTEWHGHHRAAGASRHPRLDAPSFAHSHGSAAEQPAEPRRGVERQRRTLGVRLPGKEQPNLPVRAGGEARFPLGASECRWDLLHHHQTDVVSRPEVVLV